VRAGRIVDLLGQAMLPVGVGALLGFYAADQGMRLLPTMLELALAWSLLALALIAFGKLLRGRLFVPTPEGARLRKRVVLVLLLMIAALGVRLGLHYADRPSELTSLSGERFELAFAQDAGSYRELEGGMESLLRLLEAEDVPPSGKEQALSAQQERLLLDAWVALQDQAMALDAIRVFWEGWYGFDPSRVERSYHLRSFLLSYAAELALYEKAARFCQAVLANPNAKKFLDAPHPGLDLPEDSFSQFREQLLGTRDQARVVAGEQYLEFLDRAFRGREEAQALGVAWLWEATENHRVMIDAVTPIDRAELTVRADAQLLKRSVRRAWFPLQKGTAEVMGDTRLRRIGWYLIPEEQRAQAAEKLLPGDVLISRKNWYLSNVGLPGFWPHAILYLGEPAELSAYFDVPEVLDWVEQSTGQRMGLDAYLAWRHPTAWARYAGGDQGVDHHVIEAVGEGVIFNTMEHALGDYLAGVRPELDKLAKAQAVVEAFSHWGKPYDFDFDFATEHALVCTELVYRAYRPAEGKRGLDLPLSRVAGRVTLSANLMAQHFSEGFEGTDRAPAPYEFVLFIDASEDEQRTFFSDRAAFTESWQRSKWDFAQE